MAHSAEFFDQGVLILGIDEQDGVGKPPRDQSRKRLSGKKFLGVERLGGSNESHLFMQLDRDPK